MTVNSDKYLAERTASLQNQIAIYAQTNCITQTDLLAGFTESGSAATGFEDVFFTVQFNGIGYAMSNSAVLAQISSIIATMSPDLFPTISSILCSVGTNGGSSDADCQAPQPAGGDCSVTITPAVIPVITPPSTGSCSFNELALIHDTDDECVVGQASQFLSIALT